MTKSMVTVSVKCADEVAKLNISPEDFQFVEFKAWLHGRFTISPESQLVFSDNSGAECLPTKGYFQENKTLNVDIRHVVSKEKSAKVSQKDTWISFHIPISIAVIAAWVFVLRHEGTIPYLTKIEDSLSPLGYHLKKEVVLESIINGLGWALMHLFIRRMLNPENEGKWFDGYFLDSCYGGLAAFGQTLFKGFILVTIMRNHK